MIHLATVRGKLDKETRMINQKSTLDHYPRLEGNDLASQA